MRDSIRLMVAKLAFHKFPPQEQRVWGQSYSQTYNDGALFGDVILQAEGRGRSACIFVPWPHEVGFGVILMAWGDGKWPTIYTYDKHPSSGGRLIHKGRIKLGKIFWSHMPTQPAPLPRI